MRYQRADGTIMVRYGGAWVDYRIALSVAGVRAFDKLTAGRVRGSVDLAELCEVAEGTK